MSNGTHTAPRAEQRRVKNDVRGPGGATPAEQSLARIIGETVALRLAEVVPDLSWSPGCLPCAREAKRAERDHSIAVAIATKAAEPLPDVPQVQVNQAFTIDPERGPVCWAHVEPEPEKVVVPPVMKALTDEEAAEFKRAFDQQVKQHVKSGR